MRVKYYVPIMILVLMAVLVVGCTTVRQGQITVKQSGGAGILIPECGDRDYISQTADYIIEGTVENIESR